MLVYGAALLLIGGTFVASRVMDRSMRDFSQDPTEVLDGPAYIGFLTGIATVVWSVAATSCLLAWLAAGRSARSPFLWSALFVTALLADDLFRLHESYYPQVGLPQLVVAAIYGVAGAAYVWLFRSFIRANDGWLFLLGLALLGISIATDQLVDNGPWFTEDGTKLLGIVTWALFYLRAALRVLVADPVAAAAAEGPLLAPRSRLSDD
jgi:hypothetical protein